MSNCGVESIIHYLMMAEKTDYIGEPISQLEHALQCAYFAEKSGHSDDVILASLLHDIGHFALESEQPQMAALGTMNHEWIGAKLVYDAGFSPKLAMLIGYHVDAKRYLAGKNERYFEQLSTASLGTLAFQGGAMGDEERHHFEQYPYFREILQVRINDEKGKEYGLHVPPIEHYLTLLSANLCEKPHNQQEATPLITGPIDHTWIAMLKRVIGAPVRFELQIKQP